MPLSHLIKQTFLRCRLIAGAASVGCVCLLLIGCQDSGTGASASEFPNKPIKVVVPFGAGGDSDSFARIMQKTLRDSELLPHPLVILNVPGAGGTVGSRRVRDAAPDGYTILNLHEGILTSKYAGRVPYGPEAFRPIAATGESSLVICVRDDAPFQNLGDLLKAAKEKPDSILFGMAQGTPTHFAGRRLERAGGDAKFRMVASGGGAKRFNDLVGRHIDATPFSLAEYIAFEAGGLRAIGLLATERHPAIPDVPTARELGFDVVMPHVHYWWAPKSTPDAAVERIADALEAAMSTDYLRGKLSETKTEPLFLRGKALQAHLESRDKEFQDVALVNYSGLPDPVMPTLVLIGLLLVFIVVRSLAGKKHESSGVGGSWQYGALTVGLLFLYLISMQVFDAPYLLATIIFIPVLGLAAGARSRSEIVRISLIGVVLSVGCFLIFTKVLVIDLP